jgi:hypothetical protein
MTFSQICNTKLNVILGVSDDYWNDLTAAEKGNKTQLVHARATD